MTTSTSRISGPMTSCARFSVHSFLRKLRSTLMRTPAARAALIDARGRRDALVAERRRNPRDVIPLRAGKHRRPVNRVRVHFGDRRPGAIVDDRRRALARASFGVVDADPIAAAQDVIGPHAFGAQRAHRRLADLVLRQARDVVAVDAECCQAHRNVGFTAAECGDRTAASAESARIPAGSAAA